MEKSIPCKALQGWILTGGLPSTVRICAPMRESGSATRRMGRFDREASPIKVLAKR